MDHIKGSNAPWLVVGADGTIGSALLALLANKGLPAVGTSRRADRRAGRLMLDLETNPDAWDLPPQVDVAFLCAGVASIAECRQNPDATRWINVDQTLTLARRLVERGAMIVFLSTNHVFDGHAPLPRPDSRLSPRSAYGRQKAEAETHLARFDAHVGIVRLTKVLPSGSPLLTGWRDDLRAGRVVRPFHDMRMAPVPLAFAAEVLLEVARQRLAGVTHVSAERDLTYEEAARHLARRLGADESLIEPASARAAGIPLDDTPQHTALDTARLLETLLLQPPEIGQTLDQAAGV